jgi:hypothetical protein
VPINPYTSVSITGYNSSPPPDDGSQTSANKVEWAKEKSKLADPIKTLAEGINTNAIAACNALALRDAFVSTTSATIAETDWNGVYLQLATGAIYYPDPSTYENGWHHTVYNGSTGIVNLQATATSYWLVDGALASEFLLYSGHAVEPINTASVWIPGGSPRANPGDVVGTQYAFISTCVTATEIIPHDNTIPFATEGTQHLSLSFAPSRIGNLLEIESDIWAAPQTAQTLAAAIFSGTASEAIAASSQNQNVINVLNAMPMRTWVTSTGLSYTFTVRVGAGAGAHTLNGVTTGGKFGGTLRSFIRVTEYEV